jgi:hypothetical protein
MVESDGIVGLDHHMKEMVVDTETEALVHEEISMMISKFHDVVPETFLMFKSS